MTRMLRRVIPVVLAIAVIVAVVALAAVGDDDDPPAAAPTSSDGTTQPTTTATTSTTLATTTTVPTTSRFVPRATGTVVPYETGIYVKTATSFTAIAFGELGEIALSQLSAVLGSADHDTGWRKDDRCEGSSTRRVTWGFLEIVLTKGANGLLPESLTFQQWYIASYSVASSKMVTPEGVGVGSTVSDLKHAYPEAKVTRARSSDEAGIFLTRPEGGPFIQGFTKDTDDKSSITTMWAGLACQRILG